MYSKKTILGLAALFAGLDNHHIYDHEVKIKPDCRDTSRTYSCKVCDKPVKDGLYCSKEHYLEYKQSKKK